MKIDLTPEQDDVVRHAIDTGRIHDGDQAAREAMTLWVDRERRRLELLADLDVADASLARGEGREITPLSMRALSHDVLERHRWRFASEPQTAR